MDSATYTITDLAWAAGFFDGEACITLSKPSGGGCHETTRGVVVHVTQINVAPLLKLAAMFGGVPRPMRVNTKGQTIHQWALSGQASVIVCLEAVLPFLVNKREDAEVVIAYAKTMGQRGKKLSPMLKVRRRKLIKRLERVREGVS